MKCGVLCGIVVLSSGHSEMWRAKPTLPTTVFALPDPSSTRVQSKLYTHLDGGGLEEPRILSGR